MKKYKPLKPRGFFISGTLYLYKNNIQYDKRTNS